MPEVGSNLMTTINTTYVGLSGQRLAEIAGAGNYSSYDQISSIELFTLNGYNLLAGSAVSVFGSQVG
jgi:hypothetical protein